jgi:WD40 repeat protein
MRLALLRFATVLIAVALTSIALPSHQCEAQVATPGPGLILRDRLTEIHSLAFSPDGTMIVSGGNDGKIRLWDAKAGRLLGEETVREGLEDKDPALIVSRVAFSSDGLDIVAGDREGVVQPWTIRLGHGQPTLQKRDLSSVGRHPWAFAFSQDRMLLASCDSQDMAQLRDVGSGRSLAKLPCALELPGFRPQSLAFSGDAKTLAVSGYLYKNGERSEEVIELWDLTEGRLRTTLRNAWAVPRYESSLIFSPDGSTLAVMSSLAVTLWDLGTRRPRDLPKGSEFYSCMAYSPDARFVAAGGAGEWVTIWDLAKAKVVAEFREPVPRIFGHVRAVAFSPDGKRLATGGDNEAIVRIWDVEKLIAARPGK